MCRLSWNLWTSNSWNPQGVSTHVMGLLYRYIWKVKFCYVVHNNHQIFSSWDSRTYSTFSVKPAVLLSQFCAHVFQVVTLIPLSWPTFVCLHDPRKLFLTHCGKTSYTYIRFMLILWNYLIKYVILICS